MAPGISFHLWLAPSSDVSVNRQKQTGASAVVFRLKLRHWKSFTLRREGVLRRPLQRAALSAMQNTREHRTDIDRLGDRIVEVAQANARSSSAHYRTSMAAVSISLLALAATAWPGYVNQRMLKLATQEHQEERRVRSAELRPQLFTNMRWTKDEGFQIQMHNGGPGHAVLKWFTLSVDGKLLWSWTDMFSALGLERAPPFSYSIPSPHVLYPPDKTFNLFWMQEPDAAMVLWSNSPRIKARVCFCSLLEECWIQADEGINPSESCEPRPSVGFGLPSNALTKRDD